MLKPGRQILRHYMSYQIRLIAGICRFNPCHSIQQMKEYWLIDSLIFGLTCLFDFQISALWRPWTGFVCLWDAAWPLICSVGSGRPFLSLNFLCPRNISPRAAGNEEGHDLKGSCWPWNSLGGARQSGSGVGQADDGQTGEATGLPSCWALLGIARQHSRLIHRLWLLRSLDLL